MRTARASSGRRTWPPACAELNPTRPRSITRAVSAPRFIFRLERVRALREDLEGLSREAYAQSQGRRMHLEAGLRSAVSGVDMARDACRDAVAGAQPAEMAAAHAYLLRADQTRRERAEDLRRQDREVEERRIELARASQDRQVLERLKDRGHARHLKEVEQRESMLLDEVAIGGYRRRRAAA